MIVHRCDRCKQVYDSYGKKAGVMVTEYNANAIQYVYQDDSCRRKDMQFYGIYELCPECIEALNDWFECPNIEYQEKRVKE